MVNGSPHAPTVRGFEALCNRKSKSQIPNPRSQIPNPKSQTNSKFKMRKIRNEGVANVTNLIRFGTFKFENSNLFGIWDFDSLIQGWRQRHAPKGQSRVAGGASPRVNETKTIEPRQGRRQAKFDTAETVRRTDVAPGLQRFLDFLPGAGAPGYTPRPLRGQYICMSRGCFPSSSVFSTHRIARISVTDFACAPAIGE